MNTNQAARPARSRSKRWTTKSPDDYPAFKSAISSIFELETSELCWSMLLCELTGLGGQVEMTSGQGEAETYCADILDLRQQTMHLECNWFLANL